MLGEESFIEEELEISNSIMDDHIHYLIYAHERSDDEEVKSKLRTTSEYRRKMILEMNP